MRDLTARLRAIVKQPVASRARELTYVPDPEGLSLDAARTAEALGGRLHEIGGSACVVIDRRWDADQWHGRRPVGTYAPSATAPLGLFDPRLAGRVDWASRVVFFDIETTGLSGGAGTLALLAGCGWFEEGSFLVRQFFLSGPAGERALLDGLEQIFEEASLLVTYNGRTFDVPVMETRWAYHRRDNPADELPHFDMLPIARRLWGRASACRTLASSGASFPQADTRPPGACTLTALERSVLRFHRLGDVPGLEIPSRYFQFLRTGDVTLVEGVLEHNRHDVLSLAAVTAQALRLAAEGPEACEAATEQLGLGRLYERAGELARAERAFALAAASEESDVAMQALARLAVLLRRQARHEEAAAAWEGVVTLSSERPAAGALQRRAHQALAIHHEHRARDFDAAQRYAEALRQRAIGPQAQEAQRRLHRLEKKIRKAEERPLIR
jgi:hypothetical protein